MGIRTITSYELGERKPYQAQLYKLAKALEVSTEYLQNDNIEDPSYGLDPWILFMVILVMTIILFVTSKKWVYYDN